MMLKQFGGVLLFLFSFATIGAQLTLPNTVNAIALNGKSITDTHNLTLPVGTNQIVIRYFDVLRDGSGKKKFESDPYIVILDVDKQNDQFEVSHKRLSNYSMAKSAFLNNKVNWILNKNGVEMPLDLTVLPGNEGVMPYYDIELAIKQYNSYHGISIVPMELSAKSSAKPTEHKAISVNTQSQVPISSVSNSVSQPTVDSVELHVSDGFVLKMKQWYLNASDDERKALLKWMIEQQ